VQFRRVEMFLGKTDFSDSIDLQEIQTRLTSLLVATGNRIDREWPHRFAHINSGKVVMHAHYLSAFNTYNTIMYSIADIPKDPNRKLVFSLAVPPMVRYLYESLVSHIFLLADLRHHIELLFKSGYRENCRELENAEKYHQHDPKWHAYIDDLKKELVRLQPELKLTPDEIKDPLKKIKQWPSPQEMRKQLDFGAVSKSLVQFLEYIDSWIYRVFSCESHISLPGLIERMKVMSADVAKEIFGEETDKRIEDIILNHRNLQMHYTIALMLAIATEVHIHFKFTESYEFLYVWNFFIKSSATFEDLYARRYSGLL
jgi:hypothetical protein